jgi:NTE family protein
VDSGPRPLSFHVVTLAFLSEHLPASLISEGLARSLCDETGDSVVLVRFERQEGRGATNNGAQIACLNGEFHMPACLSRTAAGFHSLELGVGSEPPSPPGITSLVNQLTRHFRHVLIEVPATERSAPWLVECSVRSDLTYLFLQSNAESVQDADRIVREARTRSGNGGGQVKPIGCLTEGEQTDALDLLVQNLATPMHMFVRGCPTVGVGEVASPISPTGSFGADVRRLAREVGGRLVGLALSSGAAKGFAHIGVIQVLEENGIEVDVIAGSSMGAYVGSLWAHGNDGKELERLARELEGRWALWTLIDPVFPPRQGFLRGFAVKRRLMRTLGHARFADLARPMRVVASNLATLERVVFSSGEVAAAVHASSAVPGVCVPVTIDGETYIDGGIADPLPVDVLREMGVSRVIAVNVVPTPERIRSGLHAGRTPARHEKSGLRKLFRKIFPVNQQLNYFARGNLFEILMRSLYGAQIRVAEASCRMADLVLRPHICDDRWLDYRHPGKFIKLGREEAERHLEEIKALVRQKEVSHEHESAPEAVATIA